MLDAKYGRAPLRISFGGGGTDVERYFNQNGGCVLSTTIDMYAYAVVRPAMFTMTESLDTAVDIRMLLAVADRWQTIELKTHSEAPIGSGLGASSALMAACVKAASEIEDRYELAKTCYDIERKQIGMAGGYQDQYATCFGGFNFIEFNRSGIVVNPLRIKDDILHELKASLILVDSGIRRYSSDIVEKISNNAEELTPILDVIKLTAMKMKGCLLRGYIERFNELLFTEWEAKRELEPSVSNIELEQIFTFAKQNGATGGKVLGAGGGGFVLLATTLEKRPTLLKELRKKYTVVPFNFESEGAVSWKLQAGRVVQS